jgi:hypothetical protein
MAPFDRNKIAPFLLSKLARTQKSFEKFIKSLLQLLSEFRRSGVPIGVFWR